MWDPKKQEWQHDEWLFRICGDRWTALGDVLKFAEGRPFSNPQETQVVRYFRKRKNLLIRGEEVEKDDKDICEREWMRYSEYRVECDATREKHGL